MAALLDIRFCFSAYCQVAQSGTIFCRSCSYIVSGPPINLCCYGVFIYICLLYFFSRLTVTVKYSFTLVILLLITLHIGQYGQESGWGGEICGDSLAARNQSFYSSHHHSNLLPSDLSSSSEY